jgi:two-component system, NarL family, nitrate/nitrite response regulator NarL
MSRQGRISVAIVAKVRLYREGLVASLTPRPEIQVVGLGCSVRDAFALADRADVILLDVFLEDALEAVRELNRRRAEACVLALAISEQNERAVEKWADAGVAGFITAEDSRDDLVAAIQCAARGEVRCSPRLAATLLRHVRVLSAGRAPSGAGTEELTVREREVLELIGRGFTNKQIALHLSIEVSTVKNHVHNILEKLHVERRAQAAVRARHLEVLDLRV